MRTFNLRAFEQFCAFGPRSESAVARKEKEDDAESKITK